MEQQKQCCRCKQKKLLSEFSPCQNEMFGVGHYCHSCHKILQGEYYNRHKHDPSFRERAKSHYRKYYSKNKEHINKKGKLYSIKNRAKTREYDRLWHRNHRDKTKLSKQRYNNKIETRISNAISTPIGRLLHGKKAGRKWQTLTGWTLEELMAHLKKQFKDGMSWDNYGQWHIDHIIPKAYFKFESASDPEFKRCWALSNLRPLWAKDNLHKSSNIPWRAGEHYV